MWCGAGSVHAQLQRLSMLHTPLRVAAATATASACHFHSLSRRSPHRSRSNHLLPPLLPELSSTANPHQRRPTRCLTSSTTEPTAATAAAPHTAIPALSAPSPSASASASATLPSSASSPPPPSDRIHLRGMLFFGRHGVYASERELGQKFSVDATLELPLTRSALTGRLSDSVDYGAVYRVVRRVVEAEQFALLEELSWHIIAEVMAEWTAVERMSVRVKKPHVAVEGAVDWLGVEMERSRAQWQAERRHVKQRKRKKDITQLNIE